MVAPKLFEKAIVAAAVCVAVACEVATCTLWIDDVKYDGAE